MKQEDLKITALNKSPQGGQHVGSQSPGVRVEHIPTGIAVECETKRSQMRNRDVCIEVIKCWVNRKA